MAFIRTLADGKPQVRRASALCELRENLLAGENEEYTEIFKILDTKIKAANSKIKQGALNNIHGDWYEWMLAIEAWNYSIDHPDSYILLILPNITSYDVVRLYQDELYNLIVDLREKVLKASTVQLITSNPDFVIIRRNVVDQVLPVRQKIEALSIENLKMLNDAYLNFSEKCNFEEIIGYASAKLSLRPDRRLQISHEGSLMKALYVHMQTREWIINPPGLKYYAISTSMTDPDRNALKTVATHSITTVHSRPQPAVDGAFVVNTPRQAREMFEEILGPGS